MEDRALTIIRDMVPNIYLPHIARIEAIKEETGDIKTFTLSFKEEKLRESFAFIPGQFVLVSVFNCGEAPISICSSPVRHKAVGSSTSSDGLQLSIKKMGLLTGEIHRYTAGDEVGLRGPYGNGFPLEELFGHDLLFVGGGIGLAPLRSLIQYVFSNRSKFGKAKILYGARTPGDLVFRDDLEAWRREKDVNVLTTVYRDAPGWKGEIGPLSDLLKKTEISVSNTKAVVCGHPAIISHVLFDLLRTGFEEDDIITTLERNMKCGVGKCGHCSIGSKFACMHGPVFTYRQIKAFPSVL